MARTVEPMTSGTIWKRMVFFAFPLFLGNLFQQLYNTVDSLIVGNFLGSSALAAVSSSGSLIFMLIGFLSGIAGGAGVGGGVLLIAMDGHGHVGARNAAGLGVCRAHRHAGQPQGVHLVHKGLLVVQKLVQGGHQHIAGCAHGAFDVKRFHSSFNPSI